MKRNDGTKELVTSNDTTRHFETYFNHWNSYDDVVITKLKWILIHFSGIGTKDETFDWDNRTEISEAESSKIKSNNKSAENNNSENNNKRNSNG